MEKVTPMMAQYHKIKEIHKDAILMFRLGDFYEMFFEDAQNASKILQIALTARHGTPMCGIPYHALDNYLSKLTRAGKKVAICDQVTEPNGKGIVEREVIRVVTPGTTFDENIIDSRANNYVACAYENKGIFGFAYCDITTGDFHSTEVQNLNELGSEILRVSPAEIIYDSNSKENFVNFLKSLKEIYAFPFSYVKVPEESLKKYFGIHSLSVFGLEEKVSAIFASGMLYEYLLETQKSDIKHIQKISSYAVSDFMILDQSCIRNLEIFYTSRDKKEGSVISILDNTKTPMGGRMMRSFILHPLLKKSEIDDRLSKVSFFFSDSTLLRNLRDILNEIFDIERLLSRLSLGTGNARDLVALKSSLKVLPTIKKLSNFSGLEDLISGLGDFSALTDLIDKAIVDAPSLTVKEGGIIKDSYNEELDELRNIGTEGKTFIRNLQEREVERTGISSLKIKFNNVFGYYIEISNTNLSAVPSDYIRKQTLVNAERFITPELKEYEEKVLNAEEKIRQLEYEIFYKVRMEVVKQMSEIKACARAVALTDVFSTFAFNAVKNNYCRPEILEDDYSFEITNGRHPVIERLNESSNFVPNDLNMNDDLRFLLITGPNMGGKSTYLRQVAIIVLMAQIGSYVPADNAKMPVFDRIFTRVGASDNLVQGESTFMVEMQEASHILNHATDKSLIILDEVGRGTSTYDGVSIAWAITEYIHNFVKAKTLFATHYHELIGLIDGLTSAKNFSVAIKENERDGVVFLYKIIEGGIDRSYGIEVAKLAGLPYEIVERAKEVLVDLENKKINKPSPDPSQMKLFEANERTHGILSELRTLDIDSLTPLQALQKLDEIKKRSGS
ncbi:MAG: DNA mismatch repair protein MutS [Candidatus Peregrinibacteria bacterium]|nr:DNA mismatch repair protein MutS [Candidatus Peregrinibacteria bacterium]